MSTIAPLWSGYPTCSGFTPVCSPSPAPARAVSLNRRASQRGAIRATHARPANRASTGTAKRVAAPPTATAGGKRRASKARARAANAKRAAVASATTRPPAPPTIAAASEGSVSTFLVLATANVAPGPGARNARGTRTADRGACVSTARAPPVVARPTKIARLVFATWVSVSITNAARVSHAPKGARAFRGSASRKRPHPSDRTRHRRAKPDLARMTDRDIDVSR